MNRNKQKQRQQKQQKRKRNQKQRQAAHRERAPKRTVAIDLSVPHPELAHAPVYVSPTGQRVPDPLASLGLEDTQVPTAEEVQTAFRSALEVTSPEADPQRAQGLLEARNLLLDPAAGLVRTVGDLRVPDSERFLTGYVRRVKPDRPPAPAPVAAPEWSSHSRLVALMTLYAFLEEELGGTEPDLPSHT